MVFVSRFGQSARTFLPDPGITVRHVLHHSMGGSRHYDKQSAQGNCSCSAGEVPVLRHVYTRASESAPGLDRRTDGTIKNKKTNQQQNKPACLLFASLMRIFSRVFAGALMTLA